MYRFAYWRRLLLRVEKRSLFLLVSGGVLLAAGLLIVSRPAQAQVTASPLHPTFPLLDGEGENVLDSGNPVSTMQTCGACHDTEFIAGHSFHTDAGLGSLTAPGATASGREWDMGDGLFGRWNPLLYRYLSPAGDPIIDLTTAEWIQTIGVRHVGGGPAETGREGLPLTGLVTRPEDPETHIVDPQSGELVPWDWDESGTVEMNCFLCHMNEPDNAARIAALEAGAFSWAGTATLQAGGIVTRTGDTWTWNPDAFNADGEVNPEQLQIGDPGNENCGLCHGLTHATKETPLILDSCSPEAWSTLTTGQIHSPQRIADSGMNIADKEELSRSWDIHAERVIECTDCHHSLNNPVYYREAEGTQPDHLTFDPRRTDFGEYLYRPVHDFAKGETAQGTIAPALDNTIRSCESCHSIETTHDWLPYKERHTSALSCQSCHVPQMYSSANQTVDWTVLELDGRANTTCRGVEGETGTVDQLVTGFDPVLLPRTEVDGTVTLAPHNLVTAWYWVYGDPARPVAQRDLAAVWLDGDAYAAEVMAVFDADQDGTLAESELVIDDEEKEALIAGRLAGRGLDNLRIQGEIQPYSISHNVTQGEWATKDCQTCHSENSQITAPMLLAGAVPGGVEPQFIADNNVRFDGALVQDENGALYYQPLTGENDLYILGSDNVSLVDRLGAFLFVGTILGVTLHGGGRLIAARRRPHNRPDDHQLAEVYMYSLYERMWHWLQTLAIFILLFTGLIIHKPDIFSLFSFAYVVQVHNIVAFILVANAFLALFYHLASGEIKQYLPRPHGFFDQAIEQALYYLRGIFRNEPHPTQKTPRRKLNPLQQITYFGILNVLLPLQIITGLLMWGVQRWPELTAGLGGLPFLAPFHTLLSWLFASFIVMHVYLTTTGHTPAANIKAMMMGYESVEQAEPLSSVPEITT